MDFRYLPLSFIMQGLWPFAVLAAVGLAAILGGLGYGAYIALQHIQFI